MQYTFQSFYAHFKLRLGCWMDLEFLGPETTSFKVDQVKTLNLLIRYLIIFIRMAKDKGSTIRDHPRSEQY